MNPYKKMNPEQLGELYKKLKQIDENRKFRKTIDKRQVVLEDIIKEKTKMYEMNKLVEKIISAVEIEKYTTYERIATESGISIVALWKIRKNKQGTTLKTAQKIATALKKLKKM